MTKEDRHIITESINRLVGEKLQYVIRYAAAGGFCFGDYVEDMGLEFDENRKLVPKIRSVPYFTLHIASFFRFTCADDIILANSDMFRPCSEIGNAPDFDCNSFNWDVQGNNLYDETCKTLFDEDAVGFIAKKVTVNTWGDLKIEFENNFILETFTNHSGCEESWRFWATDDEKDTVVTGQGLEVYL